MGARRLVAGVLFLVLAGSCYPYQQYYFGGRVYDGSTGKEVTSYTLSLQYLNTTIQGTIDSTGYYSVGPLPPYQDFTIIISASGYRPFMSHNSMYKDPATKSQESFYFDAYLFPKTLQSPAVTFTINGLDSATPPVSGTVRLQPVLPSETYGLTPAGVGPSTGAATNQLWLNAEDLQASTFTSQFATGVLSVPAGALVWGVSYDVTIYNVTGFSEFDSASSGRTFTSGEDGDTSYTLTPLIQSPLSLVFNSAAQPGVLTPDYSLTLVFNQAIVVDATVDPNSVTYRLNEDFSILSPNVDTTGPGNILNTTPATMMPVDFAGVDFTITGNTLKLTWNPAQGLQMTDQGDPIYTATYGGLNEFPIRPANNPTAQSAFVSSLLDGQSSVTVTGIAIPVP